MLRRDFLKLTASILAPLVIKPALVFVPPREPFVRLGLRGLDSLVSHLGILPTTNELNICEGKVETIGEWDGTGYPCLVKNVCTFGGTPPMAWVYDLDLWNFRHDDEFFPVIGRRDYDGLPNHNAWHAKRRFGADFEDIVRRGGGMLSRHLYGLPPTKCGSVA